MKKEYILQEIKRTAKANGGIPLGAQGFRSETGIKRYDWLGVYWATWSDALKEAGFTPNQFQVAFEKTELLDKYAKLAFELGHLPTSPELRLKARKDSNFPTHTVFDKRFGKKSELIGQLTEYCRSNNEYADVLRLCKAYAPPKQDLPEESGAQEVAIGFVYLTKSGRYYKIGKTNAAGRRERELALQLPEKATTVHIIRTDDPTGIEAYWHKRFEAKWKNGEWFDLNAADVAAFKRRKFM
jgi:hypothetical protein